jgi:hypothetical protein
LRLAALEARAAAHLGDGAAVVDAATRVEAGGEVPDGTSDLADLGGIMTFPLAKRQFYLGNSYGVLGDHVTAERHASAAVTAYEDGPPAERSYGDEALARLDVVNARLHAGDVDGAQQAIGPVLELPQELRIRQLDTAVERTAAVVQTRGLTASRQGHDLVASLVDHYPHVFD